MAEEYTLVGFGEECLNEGTYRFMSYEPYRVSIGGRVEYANVDRWALEFGVRLA